jgi:hypothetical protein
MAEDQGVNGDIWNEEASRLLSLLGWIKIGDRNIDIQGTDNNMYGVDTLLKYQDPRVSAVSTGVLMEAKRYKTTSFKSNNLTEWVKRLDTKLGKIKNSKNFYETYHQMEDSDIRTGIILIWFSDTEEYDREFKLKFQEALLNTKISHKQRISGYTRIFVMSNEHILRLCSLIRSIKDFSEISKGALQFHYPHSDNFRTPQDSSQVLTIEYMYSKFILAESKSDYEEGIRVVFYFGRLNMASFRRLKGALYEFNFMSKKNKAVIYLYQRDDEFRKIEPEVISLFDGIDLSIKKMDLLQDIPGFIKN